MEPQRVRQSVHERVDAVLRGDRPDSLPYIDRLELWYKAHQRAGTLPVGYHDLTLTEIHRQVGIGQQVFRAAYAHRLRSAEMIVRFNGEVILRETEPIVEFFPRLSGLAVQDRAGITAIEIITPVGRLTMQHEMAEEMVRTGTQAYIREHIIKGEDDYRTAEYVLERMDFVPLYEGIYEEEDRLGDIGFVVPQLCRIPFQQVLLEYLGDLNTFYALHDSPRQIDRLLDVLDDRMMEALAHLTGLQVLFVEFPDNLHAVMTNPRLFVQFCLPAYQRYTDLLHGQGKKVGSHTDGDLKPLLRLLAESGLDVCESFSPAPLTPCTFEEAWEAWRNGPIIWGGIPSPLLEERMPEEEFRTFVRRLLDQIGDRPIILGIGDQALASSLIERVRYVAEQVEQRMPH